ncbi:MAG: 30S ribosomal protein S6 [Patescibacteria group bacterium]|nr:30S ribosomal protein S6 [Patescibacteria group bacterium]
MRNYEIAVVLHPDLEIDLESTTTKVEKIITDLGGKIDKKDNWGKRKLAYEIKKQTWGIYVIYEIEIDPSKVRAINDKLNITEEVMRFLIVSLEDIRYLKKPNQKPAKKSEKSKKPAKVVEEKA